MTCDPQDCTGGPNPPIDVPCESEIARKKPYSIRIPCDAPDRPPQGISSDTTEGIQLPATGRTFELTQYPPGVDPDQVIIEDGVVTVPMPGSYEFYDGVVSVVVEVTFPYTYDIDSSGEPFYATLCGWSELSDASTPPKKYRKKTISGEITVCGPISSNDCSFPSCPGEVEFSFGGTIPGSPFTFNAEGEFIPTASGTGTTTYTFHGSCIMIDGDGHSSEVAVRCNCDQSGAQTLLNNNGTVTYANGLIVNVSLQINYISWVTVSTGCVQTGEIPVQVIQDTWDYVGEYDSECGFTETTNSERLTGSSYGCEDPDSTTPGAIPCTDPFDCYGSGLDITDENSTLKAGEGTGCDFTGVTSSNYDGEVEITLEIEDTEDDAIARAVDAGIPTSDPLVTCPLFDPDECIASYYQERSGFSFYWRESTVDVVCSGLDPETDYVLKAYVYECDYGTNDYTFAGITTVPIENNGDGSGSLSHPISATRGKQTAFTMMSVVVVT